MNVKLPYNENAEKTILGALLLSSNAQEIIISSLYDDHFYFPIHRIIFAAIKNLYELRKAIDLTTVNDELNNLGKIDEIGGISYLMKLCDNLIIEANIEFYVRLLQEKELLRRILKTMNDKLEQWNETEISDVGEYLAGVEHDVLSITKERKAAGFELAGDILERVKDKVIKESKMDSSISGVTTGFGDLDHMTSGLQRGDLVILAARPSMGKTALALNIAFNSLDRDYNKGTVAIFSVEMGSEQLMKRILCTNCRINSKELSSAITDSRKSQVIQATINKISKLNLYIDESSTIRLVDIQAKARRLKKTHDDLKLIVVDYIGLVSPNQSSKGESRNEFIAEVSRGLKALARELDVPVLCLSQLNRSLEQRGKDKRPMLSDLRDSGAIEQDADVVLFIHREDYYEKKEEETGPSLPKEAEVIVAKHRNGPTGVVKLMFDKNYGLFEGKIHNLESKVKS